MLINTYGDAVIVSDFLPSGILKDMQDGNYRVKDRQQHDSDFVRRTRLQIIHEAFNDGFADFIQGKELRELAAGYPDHAWRSIAAGCIRGHETFISTFRAGDFMDWHVDHAVDNRMFAWFIPLNQPGGGELIWNKKPFPIDGASPGDEFDRDWTCVPIINRLILMPAWYPHRSLACLTPRTLLHGHLNT